MAIKVTITEKPPPILAKNRRLKQEPISVQIGENKSELSLDAALQLANELKHAVQLIRIRRH